MSRDARPQKAHNNEGKPAKSGVRSKTDPAPVRVRTQQQLMEHLELSNSIMENDRTDASPAQLVQSTYLASNMPKKHGYVVDKKSSPLHAKGSDHSHDKKKGTKRGSMRPRRRSSEDEKPKPKPRQRGSADERVQKHRDQAKAPKHKDKEGDGSNQMEPGKNRRPPTIRRDATSDPPHDIAKKRRPTITIQGDDYEVYRYVPRERWERIKDREVNCEFIGLLRRVQPEEKEDENGGTAKPRKKPTKTSKADEKSSGSSPRDARPVIKRKSPEEREKE